MNIAKAAVCTEKEWQLDSLWCQHRFHFFRYPIKKVEKNACNLLQNAVRNMAACTSNSISS